MTTQIPEDVEVQARLASVRTSLMDAIPNLRTHRFSRAGRVGIAWGSAAALAAALTGGAIAIMQATPEQVSYSVQCYEGPSLSAKFTTVATPEALTETTGEVSRYVTDPVTTCAAMWRMGLLGQATVPSDPNAADFPVPELVGCTLENGVGAGFPREGSTVPAVRFCDDLGLAVWGS